MSSRSAKAKPGFALIDERGCTYPSAAQTGDGTIFVVYDRGRRKEKEVLLARFSEDDVLAGAFRSPGAAERVMVNKATGVIAPAENWAQWKGRDEHGEPLIFTGI